jgi:hypothetical protein
MKYETPNTCFVVKSRKHTNKTCNLVHIKFQVPTNIPQQKANVL